MSTKKIIIGLILLFTLEYLLLCLIAQTEQEDYFILPFSEDNFSAIYLQENLELQTRDSKTLSFEYLSDKESKKMPLKIKLNTTHSTYEVSIEPSNKSLAFNSLRSSTIPFFSGGLYLLSNKKETEQKLIKKTFDKIAGQ
jgi:hypothetical protein